MVLVKVLEVNAETKESKTVEKDITLPLPVPEPKGLDFEKLKTLLLNKGIIADKSEVE